jgi:prepilin-type N-terminal cleavage/methylation domain-containing protein
MSPETLLSMRQPHLSQGPNPTLFGVPLCHLKTPKGLTLIETLISVTIFALASGIVFSGIVFMARHQAAVVGQQRVENLARRLMTEMTVDSADATGMSVVFEANQNTQRLIMNKPNGQVQYIYRNGDGNENTINNNRIFRAEAATGQPLGPEIPQIDLLSPIGTNRVFSLDTRTSASRPLVNVLVRVGDRSPDQANANRRNDDLFTGRGYQSFLIDLALSRGDRVAP